FKTVKKEFVRGRDFLSLENLRLLFGDWVHWYNFFRFHSANGGLPPVAVRKQFCLPPLKKIA
ncbi:MAG: IS3 family transposase, partial [Treponema sp.]|nr:IS3 family transposase [Treponema sp.]